MNKKRERKIKTETILYLFNGSINVNLEIDFVCFGKPSLQLEFSPRPKTLPSFKTTKQKSNVPDISATVEYASSLTSSNLFKLVDDISDS